MKPLAPNTMVQNRYLVVQAIGKGGMGEVYLAVDQRLGSAVALKRTFFKDDNALGTAFEREARILARLRHPVLPKVIDHFSEGGDQYLVMEHISGDDLSKRLENANKPFPLSWVMFWADQMLDALSYLHSHEPPIIHRDIKPQNLKLTDENHIVLLDFGLSKDFDTKSTSNPLNSASVAGYSPHFASMEQIRGTGTDSRSDIYSLSATLYQLLTNTIPVDALTRADALLGGAPDPIQPLNAINPEVSPAISDVILKGIELRQDQRFSTAAEMQKALRRAFNNEKSASEAPATGLPVTDIGSSAPQSSGSGPAGSEMDTRTLDESTGSLDATLQMSSPPGLAEIKQVDAKPEVLQSAPAVVETPAPTPLVAEPAESEPETATVLQAPAASAASAETRLNTESAPPQAMPRAAATAAAGKGSSKAGLFAGLGIGAVLLLAILGVGGWYGYTKYASSAKSAATPAPSPAPSAMPSPAETAVTESSNSTVSNTVVGGDVPANSDVTRSPSNPANTGGTSTKPVATQPGKPVVAQPAKPAAPKATPKQQRDDRTVILQ